jgi:hypothetical protein
LRIKINNEDKIIPSSLREITLKQRIDFQTQHGNELDAMYKSIMEMEDLDEQELELVQFRIESVIRGVSFFTDISVDDLKESNALDHLVNLYTSSLAVIFEEEKKIQEDIEYEFTWENGEVWHLQAPEIKHGDKLTFGQFIDSKQVIQNLLNLGKNKWECLIPLCAIYLKRDGEEYEESFLYEGSERLRLMEKLPMDIALNVGFFLSGSLSLFITTSQSSINLGLNQGEDIPKNISKTLDG